MYLIHVYVNWPADEKLIVQGTQHEQEGYPERKMEVELIHTAANHNWRVSHLRTLASQNSIVNTKN